MKFLNYLLCALLENLEIYLFFGSAMEFVADGLLGNVFWFNIWFTNFLETVKKVSDAKERQIGLWNYDKSL